MASSCSMSPERGILPQALNEVVINGTDAGGCSAGFLVDDVDWHGGWLVVL